MKELIRWSEAKLLAFSPGERNGSDDALVRASQVPLFAQSEVQTINFQVDSTDKR